MRNEHKSIFSEGTQHMRNIIQQQFRIIGVRKALLSIKKIRWGSAQSMSLVMDILFAASTFALAAFTNVAVDYFCPSSENWAQKRKAMLLFVHVSKSKSRAIRNTTLIGHWLLFELIYEVIQTKKQSDKKIREKERKLIASNRHNKEKIEQHLVQQGLRCYFFHPRVPTSEYCENDWLEEAWKQRRVSWGSDQLRKMFF